MLKFDFCLPTLGKTIPAGVDGISDFNASHDGKHDAEVQLCAFDVLALGGEDLRGLPLSMRKTNLERLLHRRPEGIFVNPFETGRSVPTCFGRRSKGWCQSGPIGHTAEAHRRTGSR
ncbi:hypothetical protein [Bradyrhizobium jicamae]|uniref:hypothetical protein n=1 Tax=Bradyrhizobium jicamae TaxID=280332 RepID=UPI00289B76C2|nr:hypothetical protein [Bradyrhizobium jicamae]